MPVQCMSHTHTDSTTLFQPCAKCVPKHKSIPDLLQVTVPYLVDEEVNKKNAAAKLKELQRRSGKLRVGLPPLLL